MKYANIPVAVRLMPHGDCVPIPEPTDEKEVNTPEETLQPSTSSDTKFFLNITSAELHKVMQK